MPATHSYLRLLLFLALVLAVANCKNSSGDSAEEAVAYTGPTKFEKIDPAVSGITFSNQLKEDESFNYLDFNYLYIGGAVGVGDFNRDGLQDLYFVATQGENKLYLNKGNFKFEDVSAMSGATAGEGIKTGVCIVDINQDGWPDIYQCRTGKSARDRGNLLFINNKDMTFSESAAAYGLNTNCASNHANFFDYDRDGDLDMYLLNHPDDFKGATKLRLEQAGSGFRHDPKVDNEYVSDRMYRNNGNGTFTNVSKETGIQKQAYGLSITIVDINQDGWPDMYVGNDYVEPDNLFINNHNGTFTDRINEYMRHTCHFSMGADVADMNNDGLEDIMVLDMSPEGNARQKLLATVMVSDRYKMLTDYGYGDQFMRNVLQLNNGNHTFSEIACLAGIQNTDWSWSPLAVDFDNDGFRDLYISNGHRREETNLDFANFTMDSVLKAGKGIGNAMEYLNKIPTTEIHNYMYRNRGDLTFEDVSNTWGFAEKSLSNAAVYVDLDNDGDLDIVVNNATKPSFVYKNKSRKSGEGNYLQINLEGSAQNRNGIGSLVMLTANGQQQMTNANPIRGFLSTSESDLHFGLGKATTVDKLQIQWPDGKVQALQQVPANQRITLKYADARTGPPITQTAKTAAIFSDYSNSYGTTYRHKENKYFDFDHERLLPHKMSDNGPGLTKGDVNGDGLEDFYVGAALSSAGALLIQDKSGHFKTVTAPFIRDTSYEDTAALLFDADGDKDLDLYIGSGGNELPLGSPGYQDRLYLNDGKGNMTLAIGALPAETESAGAVAASDYDHDGDLDLIVGNAGIPGMYPKIAQSFILNNTQGKFKLVTDQVAPAFTKIGLVSDLLFIDLDKDGWDEMIVTGEWMPIEIFKNNQGKFTKNTANMGLSNSTGWWNCLVAADMDGDGDIDLVAGNTGLNTRYRATAAAPMKLYAKDFDNNGSMDPIMVYAEKGKYYPVTTRDVMIKQLPVLKKKFVRYTAYSVATIEDFFPASDLQAAQLFTANELQTCYFENQNGVFIMHELPIRAQFSPTQAILIDDFDKNGTKDILLAGNDYGIEVETARYDAGNGLLLSGDGKGNFTPVPGIQSGFWASKDVRKMQVVPLANGKKAVVVANNNDLLQIFAY